MGDMVVNTTKVAWPQSVCLSYEECLALRVPFYCEENVWNILKLASDRGVPIDDLFAVFISNSKRCIPFQMQKTATAETGGVCLWDYHVVPVILADGSGGERSVLVYDVDSTLSFPSSLANYVAHSIIRTLPGGMTYLELSERGMGHQFRVVKYGEMLRLFSSDRRHMLCSKSTWKYANAPKYMSPPPMRPCIAASALPHPHSLPLFLKMNEVSDGDAFSLDDELTNVRPPGTLLQYVSDLLEFFHARQNGDD